MSKTENTGHFTVKCCGYPRKVVDGRLLICQICDHPMMGLVFATGHDVKDVPAGVKQWPTTT